jgi:methylenetetrahydrofolate--tRNA-(uracil-5-)-methyltransferase
MTNRVTVIGAGLAGCEAAWRLSRAGLDVDLFEMKPSKFSPAHSSPGLAELVCSNSFRSDALSSAVGLLKEEMRRLGSLVMEAALHTSVPAGKALAVDRNEFSAYITRRISQTPSIRLVREEVRSLAPDSLTVLATGPLTSEAMNTAIEGLVGAEHLYFYDAIAPIVTADSLDMTVVFRASRYDETGTGDYLNCPMTEEEYHAFYQALLAEEKVPARDFEDPRYFEGCLPIEVMAERGPRTLTFGPMKPVGLTDPRTGRRPYAVVQLRQENAQATIYNLVGFQTRLKRPGQDRVFRLIPGLEKAEFVRYGSVHRNTFVRGPDHLNRYLQLIEHPRIFLAGQITGVEGYVESAATGLLAGENAGRLARGQVLITPPETTALGFMLTHLTDQTTRVFQPSNVNFGLAPPAPHHLNKRERPDYYSRRALADLDAWLQKVQND